MNEVSKLKITVFEIDKENLEKSGYPAVRFKPFHNHNLQTKEIESVMFRWRITTQYKEQITFHCAAEDTFEMNDPILMTIDRLKKIVTLSRIALMKAIHNRCGLAIPIQDYSDEEFRQMLQSIHSEK